MQLHMQHPAPYSPKTWQFIVLKCLFLSAELHTIEPVPGYFRAGPQPTGCWSAMWIHTQTIQQKCRRESHSHPGKLTWNQQITYLKRKIIFQTSIFLFHVKFPGCIILHLYTFLSFLFTLSQSYIIYVYDIISACMQITYYSIVTHI